MGLPRSTPQLSGQALHRAGLTPTSIFKEPGGVYVLKVFMEKYILYALSLALIFLLKRHSLTHHGINLSAVQGVFPPKHDKVLTMHLHLSSLVIDRAKSYLLNMAKVFFVSC